MKLKEFTDIDIDKKEDIGYDIIDDLKCHMRDDPMFYRKMYCINQKDNYDKGDPNMEGVRKWQKKQYNTTVQNTILSITELLTKEDKDALVQEIYNEELKKLKKANIKNAFKGNNIKKRFALGRLNPATTGHGLLVEAVRQGPGDAILFLTDRPAKLPTDPLNPNEKLDWARKSFPDIKIELAKNIMFAASDLYGRGYRSVTFFEGEDKLGSLLEKYNGQKSAHGFFEFEEIKFERLLNPCGRCPYEW